MRASKHGLSQDSGIGSSQRSRIGSRSDSCLDNHLLVETEKVVDDGKYIRLEDVSSSNVEKIIDINGGEKKK
ncbi:hypothetical protein NQ317_017621 [Molorchus minor]|uniref:Uncharacterized protein n=1 Tax=Molorchus minor TaxID=1323400 RepID=A0ABQ9IT25_9CUCU|nr:hypothetical protein NQ317_017621 [Molorchus minor]